MAKAAAQPKSGIRKLKPKEVLFKDNDPAESLFIIQRGQIRLFKPKGRGYIELAILRAGEVIGEMAYFDEKQSRRSASAEALISTDVIEISFQAFSKTMSTLNPWFKTIINTLANRLRATNDRVKQLEGNSVGFGKGGRISGYKFFHNQDLVRLFSLSYMVFKTHGKLQGNKVCVNQATMKFYIFEIFAMQEAKYVEFMELMKAESVIDILNDANGQPNILAISNIDRLRGYLEFFNTQRMLTDDKQLNISSKCEIFLRKILDQILKKGAKGDVINVNISSILDDFKERHVVITKDDLSDAISEGFVKELIVDKGNILTAEVQYSLLKKMYSSIRILNAVKALNEQKAKDTNA